MCGWQAWLALCMLRHGHFDRPGLHVCASMLPLQCCTAVPRPCITLPEPRHPLRLGSAAVQAGRIVLVLQPQRAQQAQHVAASQQPAGMGTGSHAAAAAPTAEGGQAGKCLSAGESGQPNPAVLVLVYDADLRRWSDLQRAQPYELTSSASNRGSGDAVESRASVRTQLETDGPWWLLDAANPSLVCSPFFHPVWQWPQERLGVAVRAAVAAGKAAMEAAAPSDPTEEDAAAAALACQRQQAVALAVDGAGGQPLGMCCSMPLACLSCPTASGAAFASKQRLCVPTALESRS